jgi:hypothetical protein
MSYNKAQESTALRTPSVQVFTTGLAVNEAILLPWRFLRKERRLVNILQPHYSVCYMRTGHGSGRCCRDRWGRGNKRCKLQHIHGQLKPALLSYKVQRRFQVIPTDLDICPDGLDLKTEGI